MSGESSASNPVDAITLSPTDEASLRDLLSRMSDAWERGDAVAYGDLFSEDARYTTAPGERLVGRAAIVESHQRVFDTVLKDTHLGRNYPLQMQPITPDITLIHSTGAVLFPGETDADVAPNGLMTLVAARRNGGWQFVSFSNTPTGRWRTPKFLWRFLISRAARFRGERSKARERTF